MAMLEVKNIGISFGGLKAVDNFSLTKSVKLKVSLPS